MGGATIWLAGMHPMSRDCRGNRAPDLNLTCICYISGRPVTTAPHVTAINCHYSTFYVWKGHNSLNCDYTFDTLKENMPKALASIKLETIHQWEHQMYRWMAAYRGGLETQAAQLQVRQFSSAKYKSHCRVPELATRAFDWYIICCVPLCQYEHMQKYYVCQFWE
jgi:hypothetical protein